MRIKIPRISIFLSVLSWMRRRRVSLKSMVWRGDYKKMFAGGGCDPQRDYE